MVASGAVLLIVILVAVVAKGKAIKIGGPVLVLRKFEVNDTGTPTVAIEGRPPGLVAWLLTTIGLNTLTTLTVTDYQILFRQASLSGEIHHVVPLTEISSTHCGYSQPIWLLLLGGGIFLFSLVFMDARALVGGILLAGLLYVSYLFLRKIVISFETTGGMVMGLSFKPSVIELVPIDLSQALRAVHRINRIVLTRTRVMPPP